MKNLIALICLLFSVETFSPNLFAQESAFPLLEISQLEYIGGFRLSASNYGTSNLNYAEGPIEYNSANNSLFIVGHAHEQHIAEFLIPELTNSNNMADLIIADSIIQTFTEVLDSVEGGNAESLDRIGGMEFFTVNNQHKLIVNAFQYYDAAGTKTHTTLLVEDATDLQNSDISGFLKFEGGAGHTSGWISPIPESHHSVLDGTHITGHSSGIPITSRTSVGPSAFAFDIADFYQGLAPEDIISTTKLLDFSLDDPLHSDLNNDSLTNNIWTHLSKVTYGFVVPNTSTYLTIGASGGHESGVCYKCTQDNGNLCGGYCTPEVADNYQHYWLWDIDSLLKVKNGELESYNVRPYDYGIFETPIQPGKRISGGTFDEENNRLFLAIEDADTAQGQYSNPPIIVVYEINIPEQSSSINALENLSLKVYPTVVERGEEINIETNQAVSYFEVLTSSGAKVIINELSSNSISTHKLSAGVYFLRVKTTDQSLLRKFVVVD